MKKGVKTQITNTAFSDGDIDLSGENPNFLDGRKFNLNFPVKNSGDYSLDYLNKVFYAGGRHKCFWIQKHAENPSKWSVYWNYCKIINGLEDRTMRSEESGEEGAEYKSILMSLDTPYYYKADDSSLVLIDMKLQTEANKIYVGKPDLYVGKAGVYVGQTDASVSVDINNSTSAEQDAYFDFENSEIDRKVSLSYNDLYLKPDNIDINTEKAQEINVTTNVVNNVQTTLDLNTSIESKFNLIEITNTTTATDPIFDTDDTLIINNANTNTGFLFTWISSTSSPANILINTRNGRVYDNDKKIELTKHTDYTIQFDTNERRGQTYLSFSNFKSNPYYPTGISESFNIQKDNTDNIKIIISNLKLYT